MLLLYAASAHAVLHPALRGALVVRHLQRAHAGRNEEHGEHRRELHRGPPARGRAAEQRYATRETY